MTIRDTILQMQDIQTEPVAVPEWGSPPLFVRGMTGAERDSFEAACLKDGKTDVSNVRAKLAVRCLRDGEGNHIFRDEDAPALGAKSAAALDRVYTIAAKLCGIGSKDVEELSGNSGGGQIDGSASV